MRHQVNPVSDSKIKKTLKPQIRSAQKAVRAQNKATLKAALKEFAR